jgi:type IV pilus assembly protein PilN
MLVEINLLPKKETRNFSLVVAIGAILLLFIIGGIYILLSGQSLNNKISSFTQQIQTTEQLIAIEQQKLTDFQSSNSLQELEKAVVWSEDYPIKSVNVLRELTALLPERGFIQNYSYNETGDIQLSVQFDTNREAAYFLKSLLESVWISDAKLNSISTVNLQTDTIEPETLFNSYMPRYVGEFTISLNKAKFKEINEEDSELASDEEGGAQP